MSEQSTTPDLVELVRRRVDAGDSGDVDAMTSFFASDGVYDSSPMGLEGRAAIRCFFEDWLRRISPRIPRCDLSVTMAPPAETIAELMEANGRWAEAGEFDRDAVPAERRWIRSTAVAESS